MEFSGNISSDFIGDSFKDFTINCSLNYSPEIFQSILPRIQIEDRNERSALFNHLSKCQWNPWKNNLLDFCRCLLGGIPRVEKQRIFRPNLREIPGRFSRGYCGDFPENKMLQSCTIFVLLIPWKNF